MPGFTYTFDSKNAIASGVHIDGSYLTLDTPRREIILNNKRFNVNLETTCQLYPKLLSFSGFSLIPFYGGDREHKEYFSQSHPPSAYSDIVSLFSSTTFSREHFHFQCVDRAGQNLAITPKMLEEILTKFSKYQQDVNLRKQIKAKAIANAQADKKLMPYDIQQLEDYLEVSKEYFPSKELEKIQDDFLKHSCKNLLALPLEIGPHLPEVYVCHDVLRPALPSPNLSLALPSPGSSEAAASWAPYVIVASLVVGTLFCFRRCCHHKKPQSEDQDMPVKEEVKKQVKAL